MQEVLGAFDGEYRRLELPAPDEPVLPGVQWQKPEMLLTPAFWATQVWLEGNGTPDAFRLGDTLCEEVVACLLGGYGIPAEVGLAAFNRLREAMKFEENACRDPGYVERLLLEPLPVNGKRVRYRFARQKAKYVAACLARLEAISTGNLSDLQLRETLRTLPGIGYKTASWIVRNWRASDQVAIIDIHVWRACQIMGVFPASSSPQREYPRLEQRFLSFAAGIGVKPSILDAVMWRTMRRLPRKVWLNG